MKKLVVSASPHIHTPRTTQSIMLDVIIALVPAVIAGTYFLGLRSLAVILTTVIACVAGEALYELAMKKKITVSDLSAVVTGILLGLNLPNSIPLWMAACGGLFAIIIVKQLYGGIGKNFMNPALAGRCFMLIAWTSAMTHFTAPSSIALSGATLRADAVSSATPLAIMKTSGSLPSLSAMFFGNIPGCIGETSALALLIGFIYLLIRRVVSVKIPLAYILSFAVLTFFFGNNTTGSSQAIFTLYQVLGGGLLLGAFFMATDYTTTPTTAKGMIIFGIGCGILTFAIRRFGGYPEGVSFSIILMNVAAPLIEAHTMPKAFGVTGGKKK